MISRPSSRPRRFSGCSKTAFLWGQVVRLGALELGDDRLAFGHEASDVLLTGEGKDTEAEPATQAASTHQVAIREQTGQRERQREDRGSSRPGQPTDHPCLERPEERK